jgi:hypothetical protein
MSGMNASEHREEQDEFYGVTLPKLALSLPDNFSLPDRLKVRLAELEEFHRTPQWQAFWEATKACIRGDEAPIRILIEDRIGQRPTPTMQVRLQQDLPQIGELTPKEMWEFIEYHATRLRVRSRAERVKPIRQSIRKFPSVDEAAKTLAEDAGSREQALLHEIEEIVCTKEAHLLSDRDLARHISNRIRRKGRNRQKASELHLFLPPEDSSWLELRDSELFLAQELAREDERLWSVMKREAGITPLEELVLERDLANLELEGKLSTAKTAKALGLAEGTIKSTRSRYRAKFAGYGRAL